MGEDCCRVALWKPDCLLCEHLLKTNLTKDKLSTTKQERIVLIWADFVKYLLFILRLGTGAN